MRRAPALLAALVVAACGATTADLPPHGEALFVVDTDLPVPALAGRLRVDVFSEDGTWLVARDIGRSDPRDWPASFSVYSDDDTRERHALVRLRAYPEGSVRPYRGEANAKAPPFVAPRAASSLADLCATAPELTPGGHVTARLGAAVIAPHTTTPGCPDPARAGTVAARVVVPKRGRYRFDVSGMSPFTSQGVLSVRADCMNPATQLTCATPTPGVESFGVGHFPRLDATLDPGTWFVFVTGLLPSWPSEVTFEGVPLDGDIVVPPPPETTSPPIAPRLLAAGEDRTPETEPVPPATVDRLVAVRLVPGQRGSVHVTLRGACAGTSALLGATYGAVDLRSATTCIDAEGVRVPVGEAPLDLALDRGVPSVAGTFASAAPCAPEDSTEDRVCLPGGVFLFGTREVQGTGVEILRSAPERIAMMPQLWMDRYEVSVARFRAAVAAGFVASETGVQANEGPIPTSIDAKTLTTLAPWCTWSTTPRGREDHPLNCIDWATARALCTFDGGDLPTEAEWEYAATAAGRRFKTTYPWGADSAGCTRGVFNRWTIDLGGEVPCPGAVLGAGSTREDVTAGRLPDVTPQGVSGLGGNVREWVLDVTRGLDDACWHSAGLFSPRCMEADAPFHVLRGGTFGGSAIPSTARGFSPTAYGGADLPGASSADPFSGLRCVYHARSR